MTDDDPPPAPDVSWHVYLVRCADDTLYTGIATDVARRLDEHEGGVGAKYLRGRGPLELVYEREIGSRSAALRTEHRIKRLSRTRKEELVAGAELGGILCDPKDEPPCAATSRRSSTSIRPPRARRSKPPRSSSSAS